jgi:hypothetical protein
MLRRRLSPASVVVEVVAADLADLAVLLAAAEAALAAPQLQ